MKFSCEQCGTRYSIADQKVEGKRLRIRCKVCNFIMDVRGTPRHLIQADVSRSETKVQAAPDLPADQDWYVAKDGEPIGPITFGALAGEIKSRRLARDVLVWNETFSDWKEASDVPELARLLPPPVPVPPPSPTSPELGDEYPVDQRGVAPTDAATEPAQYGEALHSPEEASEAAIEDRPSGPGHLAATSLIPADDDLSELSLSDLEPVSLSGDSFEVAPSDSVGTMGSVDEISSQSISEPDTSQSQGDDVSVTPLQRDQTELLSLGDMAASVSAVEADDGVLPEAADSEVPIEPTSESSVDSSEASSVDLLDSVADAVAVEGVSTDEDISASSDETEQASVSLDTDSLSNPEADASQSAPVWLGTDDGLPQFVASADTVPLDSAVTAESSDEVASPDEGRISTVEEEQVDEAAVPSEAFATSDESSTTNAVDQADALSTETVEQAPKPLTAVPSAEAPFVMPPAPTKQDSNGSSKTIPAVLIAVVGIVLVTFLVLRDDEPTATQSAVTQSPSASQIPARQALSTVVAPPKQADIPSEAVAALEPQSEKAVTETLEPVAKTDVKRAQKKRLPANKKQASKAVIAKSVARNDRKSLLKSRIQREQKKRDTRPVPTPSNPESRSGLLAKSIEDKPKSTAINPNSLLAALRDSNEDADENGASAYEGAVTNKSQKRGSAGAEKLLNRGSKVETLERRTLTRSDNSASNRRERFKEEPVEKKTAQKTKKAAAQFPSTEVKRVFNRERSGITNCYNRHLRKGGRPLSGSIRLVFTVRPNGRGSNVSIGSKYHRTAMRRCLSQHIRRLRFPTFEGKAQRVQFGIKLSRGL